RPDKRFSESHPGVVRRLSGAESASENVRVRFGAAEIGRMEQSLARRPRVIIVGAGFGGLEVAKKLACEKLEVTVVDRTNYHLFQPLLYQVATAALSPADIAAPVRGILSECRNVEVI